MDAALRERNPVRLAPAGEPAADSPTATSTLVARSSTGPLAGSVLDRDGWGNLVHQLRERTVRRS
ncbi:hypothetical protein [Blastococcus sp. TML/M2B]|uniref:hypothetical protein n=1 Tax=Blastococcus sp. TML/M2B TaxID=2798727 RepID=UPI001F5BF348|nr:hypothetical protein [Blastococcus sp. TML/M2B]